MTSLKIVHLGEKQNWMNIDKILVIVIFANKCGTLGDFLLLCFASLYFQKFLRRKHLIIFNKNNSIFKKECVVNNF